MPRRWLAREAADLGIKLGLALGSLDGKLDPNAGDFEVWLRQAIQAAGLEGYAPKLQ